MQTKFIMYHLSHIDMANEKTENKKCWQGYGEIKIIMCFWYIKSTVY
jgi:hypothetical protein